MSCLLKPAHAFRIFMTKIITNRTFYFIFKSKKFTVGPLHDRSHTPLFFSFSSHDSFVGNTLNYFVSKVVTRETLAIEEIPAIINPADRMIVVDLHS